MAEEREAAFAALKNDTSLFKAEKKQEYVGSKWQCSCNWKNPLPDERCSMCGKPKPASFVEVDGDGSDSWDSMSSSEEEQDTLRDFVFKPEIRSDRVRSALPSFSPPFFPYFIPSFLLPSFVFLRIDYASSLTFSGSVWSVPLSIPSQFVSVASARIDTERSPRSPNKKRLPTPRLRSCSNRENH